ncbi:hypothetical protein, partial [Clostridioides difficile]|uniref:hypothetical protein n=1 Tax=Clostridioides difficile TaxID=1496 RepID=UPI00155AADE6
IENILLGMVAFVFSIPLGFLFSQFVSLIIVKVLGIPEVIFIALQTYPCCNENSKEVMQQLQL